MAKQEEIQRGIADILEVWMGGDLAMATARTIMAKEQYQGVVITVDRELPDWIEHAEFDYKAGYKDCAKERTVVEPLIKEG